MKNLYHIIDKKLHEPFYGIRTFMSFNEIVPVASILLPVQVGFRSAHEAVGTKLGGLGSLLTIIRKMYLS